MLFDVTDKTSISHFFDPRYRRFFSKKMVLVPPIWLPTPCASRLSSLAKDFLPIYFIVAPDEVAVLLGLAGDGVSDGVCFRDCDIICHIGVL